MVDINGTLLIQIVNFLIFVAILGHFCYKPIIKVLDERKQHIKMIWILPQTTEQMLKS